MQTVCKAALMALAIALAPICAAQIAITEAVIKEPVPGQTVGAGYFMLANMGDSRKVLVGVSSKSADRIEMHRHVHHHGMMAMEEMSSVVVPANSVLKFEQGGNHLMLFNPGPEALESGTVELLFEFESGESVAVTASVESWQ